MSVIQRLLGTLPEGDSVDLFVLTNPAGLEARIMSYGGTLVVLRVPDRFGTAADVVLGFDDLGPYLGRHPYFGTLIGRYANRIAGGRFSLQGTVYQLTRNDGANHLHGGIRGFDKALWSGMSRTSPEGPQVEFSYLSRHGEEGYPGNLGVTVVYTLTNRNELRIDYTATTDRPTVLNLTHHAYFNLAGYGAIHDHVLRIAAEHFLPVDHELIPTGERRSVRGTPMDFTRPTPVGARIDTDDEQLSFARGGYDHTWVLDRDRPDEAPAVEVYEPGSGRVLTVETTQPGIRFYSGNFLNGSVRGKGGQLYGKHHGFCLEPQHFPNSPNEPDFPSTLLMPGEVYRHTTTYGFGVRE
jgi:aldose 1-epimerase